MGDVKRYEAVHLRYDDNNIRYGDGCEVEVVLATDYATLEAERNVLDLLCQERFDELAMLKAELAKLRAGQEPVRFWFIGDAGQQKGATYCKKSSRDGSLAFFECEEDAKRAALRHPGTEVYPVEYYRKPQATPQPSAVPAEAASIAEEIDWLIRQWDAKVSWSGERMAELLEAAGKAAAMLAAAPSAPKADEYRCRKCGEKTPPPEPYKAYVLCDCGYMTSATAAIAAARKEGGKV